ncbi:MAG: Hsp20/alpha crystallin family protein [Bryobacterales bacterium]
MRMIHTTSPACGPRPHRAASAWAPPVDVLETEQLYLLRIDVPGVDEKAVSVELEQGVLRVKGERKQAEAEGASYKLRERRAGAFRRNFRLPDAIDAEGIEAKFDRGVLEIRIPKVERSRKIPIQ